MAADIEMTTVKTVPAINSMVAACVATWVSRTVSGVGAFHELWRVEFG